MLNSIVYPLLGLGLLEQLSTASPLNAPLEGELFDPVVPRHHVSAKDNPDPGLWPLQIIDWPFSANRSKVAATDAKLENMLLNASTKDDGKVGARCEISKAFIDNSCGDDQKKKILAAWDESRLLVDAQTKTVHGYRYDIPHSQWLGKDWNSGSSWILWRTDFRKRNQENFSRLKALFSKDAPQHDYIYFCCTDPHKNCKETDQTETIAYQWSDHGFFWSIHYINFCPPWETLPTLNEKMDAVKNSPHNQKVMENFEGTRTGFLFHELWHMDKLVSVPRPLDYAYQAQDVWDLAKDKGTWWSTENADSYHLDAVAIHVQQTFKSSISPVPHSVLKSLDLEAFQNSQPPPKHNYITKVLPDKEEAFKLPDMNVFDEITYELWPDTTRPSLVAPKPGKSS